MLVCSYVNIYVWLVSLFVQQWYMSSGSTSSGTTGFEAIPVFQIESVSLCLATFTSDAFVGRAGEYVTVQWSVIESAMASSVSLDSVSLSLYRDDGGGDYYYYFDDLVPNTGSYSLQLPSDVDAAATYGVRVRYSDYCGASAAVQVLPAVVYTVRLSGK